MPTTVPSPSEMTCVLPPQLLALGEALTPIASSARRALTRRVRSSGLEFVTLVDLTHHMGVVEHALSHLTPRLDGLMSDVIRKDGVGMLEIGRSAGRFEQVLCELVDGFLEAKASRAGPEDAEARTLILGVYRHHIRNICDWLDNLVTVISNPARECQRRGVEPSDRVELTVPLNMTSPPEMAKLNILVQTLKYQSSGRLDEHHSPVQERASAPGLLGTIGALVFGLGVSGAVFGRGYG